MNAILDVVDAFHTVRDRKGPFYRLLVLFFFLMIRRPPRSTLFPTRRSSDLGPGAGRIHCRAHRRSGEANGSRDRKSTRLNSSHTVISYAVFCLKKKKTLPDHVERRLLPLLAAKAMILRQRLDAGRPTGFFF